MQMSSYNLNETQRCWCTDKPHVNICQRSTHISQGFRSLEQSSEKSINSVPTETPEFLHSRRLKNKEMKNSLMVLQAYSQIYHTYTLSYTYTTIFSHA